MHLENRIEFFCPLEKIPTVTHQQKKIAVGRNGKPMTYEPERLKEARAMFMARFGQYRPKEPLPGPLRLVVKWLFPQVKGSWNGQPKTTKPDTDNLNKLPKDCMTALGFWGDDAQVADERIVKVWGEPVGVYVLVEVIG